METRYCPVLRHSNAEMNAFKNLKISTKVQMLPIIEGKRIPKNSKHKWDKTLNSSGKYLLERVGSSVLIIYRTILLNFRLMVKILFNLSLINLKTRN